MRSLIFLSTVPFMIHGMQQPQEKKKSKIRSLFDLAYDIVSTRPSQATTLVAQSEYWKYIFMQTAQQRFALDKDHKKLNDAILVFGLPPSMAREKEVSTIQAFRKKQTMGSVKRFVQAINTINKVPSEQQGKIWEVVNAQS